MSDINDLNFKTLIEHANIGVVIHKWDTSIVYANPTALDLLRLSYEQIIGKDAFDPQWRFLDEYGGNLPFELYPVNKVIHTKKRLINEILGVIDSTSEHTSWFMVNAYFEGEPESDNCFIVITFVDISDSKQLFSFQDIVENTQDIVIVTEAENVDSPLGPKIVYVNHAFEQLTGYSKQEVIGETPRLLQGELTDKATKQDIYQALKNKQSVSATLLNYDINGRPYWIEMNIMPLKNKFGDVTHFAAIERDISERKFHLQQLEQRNIELKRLKQGLKEIIELQTSELRQAKAKLEKLAYIDHLTDIPNRRHFIDQSRRVVTFCQRRNLQVGFGLVDIDNFKKLNDTYGHDAGDKVLQAVAEFLKQSFRTEDVYCRFGGEEFAFTAASDNRHGFELLAERLVSGIAKLTINTDEKTTLSVTISLGLKIANNLPRLDIEDQIKLADKAMYQAKRNGKNQFTIID